MLIIITAAIYARKSRITEKGDSIENQIKICKHHTENMDIDKYLIYKDEGFSGKNTLRPEFLKLLSDAKQKKYSLLICYKLGRVSRSVSDFSNLIDELQKLGIGFISVNEQFDTTTAMGRAMMYICSVFGQLERETISIRVRDNMYSLAQSGKWMGGEAPTGFESKRVNYSDENGKEKTYCILSPIEHEQELVRFIYSKYLELGSLTKLHKLMLSENIKTKNGTDWSCTTLKNVLSNPAYVRTDESVVRYLKSINVDVHGAADGEHGILIYNRKQGKNGKNRSIEDWIFAVSAHEGIIDSDSWIKAQTLLTTNKFKAPALGSSSYALLSGIIRCAKCNSFMRVAYGKQYADLGKKKFYYMCSLKHNSGKTRCTNRNIDGWELDNIIIHKLKEMAIDKNTLITELQKFKSELENSEENVELKYLQQNIKQNSIMLQNLLNNVSLTNDKETAEILLNKISEIKDENKSIQNRLAEIKIETENQGDIIDNCDTFMKILKDFSLVADEASVEEKRRLVASIIDKIYVDGDSGKVTVKFKGVDAL